MAEPGAENISINFIPKIFIFFITFIYFALIFCFRLSFLKLISSYEKITEDICRTYNQYFFELELYCYHKFANDF